MISSTTTTLRHYQNHRSISRRPSLLFLPTSSSFIITIFISTLLSTCSAFGMTPGNNRWPPAASSTTKRRMTSTSTNTDNETTTTTPTEKNTDCIKTADVLSLASIRDTLIRQEETIIFGLIERAQFRQNNVVYEKGGLGVDLGVPFGSTGWDSESDETTASLSLFEYMLIGTEALHCAVRRYTSPEEHAFFPQHLPPSPIPALSTLEYPPDLLSSVGDANAVNFNSILLRRYVSDVVPSVAYAKGDDEQYGSTALADISVLQALSRRVHYGKFVAESKYRSHPEEYRKLVEEGDAEGVMRLLTNDAVERQVLRRARLKAGTYGREPLLGLLPERSDVGDETMTIAAAAASAVVAAVEAMDGARCDERKKMQTKVDPGVIESVYRDIIIPLTKDIEVAYLFRRCGRDPPEDYDPERMGDDKLRLTRINKDVL